MNMTRRSCLGALSFGALGSFAVSPALAATTEFSQFNAWRYSFPSVDGGEIRLGDLKNKVVLVVNTASQCGYSGQFVGLEQLYLRYGPRGLVVLAIPSNDFGGQEPGGATEIKATAKGEYHVTFPIAAKTVVKGDDAHPFYKWTAELRPRDVPRWNFHKYLIARDGHLAAVFNTAVEPTAPKVIAAIVAELGDA
jgi:glutathione peroxidase